MPSNDLAHNEQFPATAQVGHDYGPQVHLLADAAARSRLARLSEAGCVQPTANRLILACYRRLIEAAAQDLFPSTSKVMASRMVASTEAGNYQVRVIDPDTRVVLAAVARAGTLPAYEALDLLCDFVQPEQIRVDHLFMNRSVDAEGHVTGVDFRGSKIGGDVEGAMLLVPDPMGATGSSIIATLDKYKADVDGEPAAVVLLHLIITPEYLRAVLDAHPQAHIYALRLDRGLSSEQVLQMRPGQQHAAETGLNTIQYIVPGAGGLGELMNNANV